MITTRELSQNLEVSKRTTHRDIQGLSLSGAAMTRIESVMPDHIRPELERQKL